ncbi:MAG: SLC13 family permease [Peptococcaceae bacterium]|nr:SLC13 family permease [Peptococcaceae bacterium]
MMVLIVGAHFMPPVGAITEGGMKLLGVFLAMLYGWTFCDLIWVSMLGIVAIGFSGVVTLPEFLVAGFGSDSLVYILFLFFFTGVISDVGLVDYISNKMISFKFLTHRPWLFSTFVLIGSFIAAAFINMFAAMIVFWEIIFIVSERFGFKPKEAWPTLMIFGVAITSIVGGAVMPYKPVPMVVLSTYSETAGVPMDFAKYIAFALPITILITLFYVLICRFIFRPDLKNLSQISVDFVDQSKMHLDKKQKAAIIFLIVFIFMMVAPSILPKEFFLTKAISALGNTGTILILLVLMCLIKFDGEAMADFRKLSGHVNWGVYLTMCFVIPFASVFTGKGTGIKETIVGVMQPLLVGKSEMVFILLVTGVATILTNVANNMVIGAIFVTLIVTIGGSMGMDVAPIVAILIMCVNLSFITPAASANMAMTFAMKDWVRATDIYKYGTITVVLCLIFTLVIALPWANVIY